MKILKSTLIAVSLFVSSHLLGQNNYDQLSIKSFAPPASPAFVLMDIAPSNIVVPDNINAFSLQTLSSLGDVQNFLSNNSYAVELQPYWYKTNKNIDFYTYNNLEAVTDTNEKTILKQDIFGNVWKQASFSAALMNGTFDVFEQARSYISVGGRTKLIKVHRKKSLSEMEEKASAYMKFMSGPEVRTEMLNGDPGTLNSRITSLKGFKKVVGELESALNQKPKFSLDLAVAYSHFLGDQSENLDGEFGRFGAWLSSDWNFTFEGDNNFIHLYSTLRYLRDGLNLDGQTGGLTVYDSFDYGMKFEIELKNFSLAYEYIKRETRDIDNGERSMGTLNYKISDDLTIKGGFGKNFISDDDTVTIFGIQFGMDLKSKVTVPN